MFPSYPIVAAGGVAYGSQVASLLTLGADAVACGTRFLFTPESCYSDQMKAALVKSEFNHTARSNAYDQAFQTDFWPSHIDGRAISTNEVMSDFKAGLPLEERIRRYKEATDGGKDTHLIMWAGVGVAHTNEIKPAKASIIDLVSGTILLNVNIGCIHRATFRGFEYSTADTNILSVRASSELGSCYSRVVLLLVDTRTLESFLLFY
jgi:NAD(P)H-dependent flavin oxidoreductase YrpB (nitropropane dioxygenase family)